MSILDPALLDLLAEVIRQIQVPAAGGVEAGTPALEERLKSGFEPKPGALPPAAPSERSLAVAQGTASMPVLLPHDGQSLGSEQRL